MLKSCRCDTVVWPVWLSLYRVNFKRSFVIAECFLQVILQFKLKSQLSFVPRSGEIYVYTLLYSAKFLRCIIFTVFVDLFQTAKIKLAKRFLPNNI